MAEYWPSSKLRRQSLHCCLIMHQFQCCWSQGGVKGAGVCARVDEGLRVQLALLK